ncbi:MAG TPA: OmpA family protein [Bacteroidia bacterium]|jgi:outer membrane protein OmpA-like peptidoglycan-associated protein/Tol biopolymer transport system component|nr:OmpA family protein [Bacteroidia bacterium]
MKRLFFIFNFTFLILNSVFPQANMPPGTYTSTNKKAIKNFEEGKKYYEIHKDAEAEKCLLKAIDEDKTFVEPHIALAYLYMEQNKKLLGIQHFKTALELNSKFFPRCFFDLALAQLMVGEYEEAQKNLETYLKLDRVNPTTKEQAQKYLKTSKYGAMAVKNPKPFKPVNLGKGVNSPDYEYFPSITADGKTLYFTRNYRKNGQDAQEDFFVSQKVNDVWQTATPVDEINSAGNEGAPSISADGQYMFYASCVNMYGNYGDETRKGYGSCDIFFAQQINGKWTHPQNIGPPVNTANWETQPSFSSDGKTLYFIRGIVTREGIKDQDIYMSEIDPDGKFGQPVKLGPNINTPGIEESVYIHPDNQTLYFTSDGHDETMGGLDIYLSRRQPDGTWGLAINLGYPINTYNDENSLLVDPSGQVAYFASDREGGFGGLDLYGFELPADVRPTPITFIKGKVFDIKTKTPLDANVEVIDLETQKTVVRSFSNTKGEFLTVLTAGKNYLVNVSREKYLYYSDNFSLKNVVTDFNKPFILEIPLQPIDTGVAIELKNIFFDVDKFDLKPESKAELEKLVSFLKDNPKLRIEISGHTDNDGNKKANQLLSQNRAKAVYDYCVAQGVVAARLIFKGYGDGKPKVPNTSVENKAKNRRTEIKIIGK